MNWVELGWTFKPNRTQIELDCLCPHVYVQQETVDPGLAIVHGSSLFIINAMCLAVTPGNAIAATAAAVASHRTDDSSETTKRSSNMHRENTRDEETLVRSSNDRKYKLALHIGCIPNAKEYPHCCLPVISLLCTALAHAHACIQSLTRKPHFYYIPSTRVELASTHIRMWVGFNPGSTWIHRISKWVQCGHAQPELNPSSTWVQVAMWMCLNMYTVSCKITIFLRL